MEAVSNTQTETEMAILFVDDEMNVLRALRRLFMDEVYEVIVANSGEEGLTALKDNPQIGLIVSDQRMPGMTGVDFLEQAKQIQPDALRILLTGYADINAVADAINRGGAYRYVTKPWKDEELLQVINEAVQQYSLKKENRRLQTIVEKQNEELKNWNSQLEFYVQEQTLEIQNKNKELESLNVNLRANFKNTISAFSRLLELRDSRTGSHSKNVAEISVKTARAMGLPAAELETITVAALLHDIGKIGITDSLFIKEPEEMDSEGKKEYMKHSVRGQAAIDSVESLRSAGILIRHHHEHVNGSGFPDRLSGREIPLGSRIIAAADYIERNLRKLDLDGDVQDVIAMMLEKSGTLFDPEIMPHIESTVKDIHSKITVHKSSVEMECKIEDIQIGMVVSRDVKSGTGITLLTKGTPINSKNLHALRRYYELDPSQKGIFVHIKR